MPTRITLKLAARLMGMSEPTLRKLMRAGAIDIGTIYRDDQHIRAINVIIPGKLADYLGIDAEELERRIDAIQKPKAETEEEING